MTARRNEQTELRTAPEACVVAVVYDNDSARNLAIHVCDTLSQTFSGDLEFDVSWWRFNYLADPLIAGAAAQAAATADLILVILGSESIPGEVKAWFERWLSRRESMEGALVVGRASSVGTKEADAATDAFLRLAAKRAHLDFVPLFASGSAARLQDRLREDDAFPNPAGLDRSLDRNYHSSGWGINE
jgi:hypothetical protein